MAAASAKQQPLPRDACFAYRVLSYVYDDVDEQDHLLLVGAQILSLCARSDHIEDTQVRRLHHLGRVTDSRIEFARHDTPPLTPHYGSLTTAPGHFAYAEFASFFRDNTAYGFLRLRRRASDSETGSLSSD